MYTNFYEFHFMSPSGVIHPTLFRWNRKSKIQSSSLVSLHYLIAFEEVKITFALDWLKVSKIKFCSYSYINVNTCRHKYYSTMKLILDQHVIYIILI